MSPVWRALSRQYISVEHYRAGGQWHFTADRLIRRPARFDKIEIVSTVGPDPIGVVIAALPVLPGLRVRLALLSVL